MPHCAAMLVVENRLIAPQQWCHIAGVSGKDGMKLYLDGVLIGTNANTSSLVMRF